MYYIIKKEPEMQNDKTVHFRLPTETFVALNKEAESYGVTLSWLIRNILKDEVIKNAMDFTGRGGEIKNEFRKVAK
jgi:predicted HicB family RNase H-like nuclease